MKLAQIKQIKSLSILVLVVVLSGCATTSIKQINSENHNDRIRYLVIHHTTINYQKSVEVLTRPNGVSAHYLIPESNDSTYPNDKLEVVQLVDEKNRAWHAGRSHWQGQSNLNDQSIGIELVYLSPCDNLDETTSDKSNGYQSRLNSDAETNNLCFYPDFDNRQIDLLIELINGILERNPDITATRIIGHADITPDRRIDPGPRFPWQRLYKAGIGAWYEQETVSKYWKQFVATQPSTGLVQAALAAYGYGVLETANLDSPTVNALTVFQMHFRPWEVTGDATVELTATLFALLERYFPKRLQRLMTRFEREQIVNQPDKAIYEGQIDGHFSAPADSARKYVHSRKIFKSYQGQGSLKISSDSAKKADIFINGKKATLTADLSMAKAVVDISKYTQDGFNSLKVENIRPKGSSLDIEIPFPTLSNSIGKSSSDKAEGFSAAKLAELDAMINKDIADGFPGAALLIVKNGKVIKKSAYGYSLRYDENGSELKSPVELNTNTLFDMASNTKMYATNYGLMKLVSEGKLDITAPISRYIPEYRGHGRRSRTVKDLLTHSAGYAPTINFFTKDNQLGEAFYSQNKAHTDFLITQRVPFEIGRGIKTKYSDTDYMLLGILIERITKMPLDEYVEAEIFKPLGLTQSTFNPLQKGFKKEHIAATELRGNSRDGRIHFENIRHTVIQGEVHDEKAFYSMGGVSGHAGLFSTLEDTAVLASVLLNRGGYGDVKLFDKNVIDQFVKPADLNVTFGLGWRRAGNGQRDWQFGPYASPYAIGHTGWTGTLTVIDPFYDLIIVLLTNKKHSPIVKIENGSDSKNYKFSGDAFETGRYGSVVSLVYEAFLEQAPIKKND